MGMTQNSNKICQISKDFSTSLSLQFYDCGSLTAAQEKRGRERLLPHLIAELYVRYCFSHDSQISDYLKQVLDGSLSSRLFVESLDFPWGNPRFATDLDSGASLKIKTAVEERWKLYSQADGAFPVCSDDDAFLLPFTLARHEENTPWVIDYEGKEIPEWSGAVACMKGNYQVKVILPSDHPQLTGHSLQLPVFLSILVKDGKFPPFDPFRFIITGALDAGRLNPVLVMTKYKVLQKKYPGAVFACPRPREDCGDEVGNNVEIMPVGLSLPEIRNLCSEAVHFHHLLKEESRDGQLPGKDFFGRDEELRKIHQLLNPDNGRKKKVPLLLGASGMGKTGLALQYGKVSHPFEYPQECVLLDAGTGMRSLSDVFGSFWIDPISKERFGFDIPDEIKKPDEKFKLLIFQLEKRKHRILFILDNLSEELQLNAEILDHFKSYQESCIDFIATATSCRFSVTTSDPVEFVHIEGLSEKDGVDLLDHKHSAEGPEEVAAAREIVRFLGGNAWALDVVGETLKQLPEKFDDDYREKLKELQSMPLQSLAPSSDMVRISHGREISPESLLKPVLDHLSQDELEIAKAAACCAPEYIYPEWLKRFYEHRHGIKFEDDKQWRRKNIIAGLKQRNILLNQYDGIPHCGESEFKNLRMHRLTHIIICNVFNAEMPGMEKDLMTVASKKGFENNRSEIIAAGHLLMNITSAVADALNFLTSGTVNLLYLLLRYNQYTLAENLITLYLNKLNYLEAEEDRIKNEVSLLNSRVDINIVRQKFNIALADIERVCDIRKKKSDAYYCSSLCKKANVLIWLKNFDRAASCLHAAQYIIDKSNLLNTKVHADFLTRSAILDNWLEHYERAEEKLLSALSIRENILESKFEIIYLLHLLGDCCRYQNKFEKSLDYYNKCEQFYLDSFGEINLSTARLFFNKANLLWKHNDYNAASMYLLRAMHIHEVVLGTEHPFTKHDYFALYKIYELLHDTEKSSFYKNKISISHNWLTERRRALTLSRQEGKHAIAEQKLLSILESQNDFFDGVSDEISFSLFELAEVQVAERKYVDALNNVEKAYKMLKICSPDNSSWDSWYFTYLSLIYSGLNDPEKQVLFAEKALAIEQAKKPCNSEKLAIAYNGVAVAYRHANQFNKAENLHIIALKTYPENDSNLASLRTAYARTLIELGRYDEALKFEQEALDFRITALPPQDENLVVNHYDIGKIMLKLGDKQQAVHHLQEALKTVKMPEYEGKQVTEKMISDLLSSVGHNMTEE